MGADLIGTRLEALVLRGARKLTVELVPAELGDEP
jgi:hypothetical protein